VLLAIVLGSLLLIGLVCGGVLIALLLPAVSAARNAAQTMQASNNLKQVGLAFHNYHSAYRQLPAAAATDATGNPIWSWRVALLPFVEEPGIWDQWVKNRAWDSPANDHLLVPTPLAYASPMEANPASDQTHIFAVRSPQSMMSGAAGLKFAEVTDGLSNTILAVYLPRRSTSWAAPNDITPNELQTELDNATPSDPVMILFGDGAVRRFDQPIDSGALDALITRGAGDVPAI
jgi:type II secretory pathway pseudopilin PulG